MKPPKNSLLQIYVPFIKRVTALSHVIFVPFLWLVHLASYSNTVCAQMSWLIWMNINFSQTHNMHLAKRHSCESQLTTVINDWAKILDNRGQVDTFILDFEQAFDTPPHELFKCKLFCYGIGGKTLKWIESFLCYRQERVVNGAKSDWTPVLFWLVSHRALSLVPCCFLCTLMISQQILILK